MTGYSELIRKFIRTNRMHKELVDARVSTLGLHRSQHMMLMCISRFEKEPTQREIAEHLEISPASAAETIKKLESSGFIARSCDKNDTRCNVINITDKGKKILADTHKIFESINEKTFEGLSEAETEAFVRCLSKMQENIENHSVDTGKE